MTTPPKLTDASLRVEDRYAVLTFERDDVRNALTGTALVDDICAAIDWANHSDLNCLIITGAGKGFSSGGNIKEMADKKGMFGGSPMQISDSYRRGIQRMSRAVFHAELPLIAAVNGAAVGAGFDLACMCDIRLGCEHTLFGETFINLGIIPGDGGAWFLQRLVGYQRAAELTFSGRLIKADEARSLGLLLDVVDSKDLLANAEAMAQSFAKQPPQALRASKRLMKIAQRQELNDFLDHCASVQAACHYSEDHSRALNAFINKESTTYSGE
ncbi:enoyl-CoA hydratase-related protein [Litorivivens sp.]|uniref:enoyl-CoA hydratase-related protein n=1 Tax=Litorivivens sp. TaxID=2020868 RepID=UPI00356990A3